MNLKRYIQRVNNRLCICDDLSRDAEQMIQSVMIHIYFRILSTSCLLLSTTYKACKDTSHLSPKRLLTHVCELLFSGSLLENMILILNERSSIMRQYPIFIHTTIRDDIGNSCFKNPITLNKQFTLNVSCLLEYVTAEIIELAGSNPNLIIRPADIIDAIKNDEDFSACIQRMNIVLIPSHLSSAAPINQDAFLQCIPKDSHFSPNAQEFLQHYYHLIKK